MKTNKEINADHLKREIKLHVRRAWELERALREIVDMANGEPGLSKRDVNDVARMVLDDIPDDI